MELEGFVQSQTEGGEYSGEGEFTIARDQALKLLSRFQLPYRGAWAIKLIQSAVCSGTTRPIHFNRGRGSIFFRFNPGQPWNLDQIESSFFDSESSSEPALDHLKRALWAVGLQGNGSFALRLVDSEESLVWNGEEFARQESEKLSYCELEVNVGHDFRNEVKAVKEALYRYAFPCPVPLYWDTERCDGLQLCPDQGLRDRGTPMLLNLQEGEHSWLPPSGTFGRGGELAEMLDDEWQRLLAAKALHLAPLKTPIAFGYLLSYRVWYEELLSRWRTEESRSTCYWLRDGVVVDTEKFGGPSTLSLAVFVSAQGLESDLTTLQLRDGPQKEQRLEEAMAKIPTWKFEVLRAESFYSVGLDRSKARRRSGGAMILGGVVALSFTLGLSLLVTAAGWRKHRQCELEAEAFDQQLNTALVEFIAHWRG